MITFRTGRVALIVVLAALMASCSREQQDWRSAEAADTSEAYGRFVEQHPDSELAARARERLAQLEEERDWADAGRVASVDAYRQFLARHPGGKWSEEARIRIEAFSLGSAPRIVPAESATGQLYRLQAPAAGEAQARALCDSLKEQAQPCVPVLPH